MPQEIERKFLVLNDDWKALVSGHYALQQGYLSSVPERTVRVRIKGDKGILTIKGKTEGIARAEFEYEIPLAEARDLLVLCEKPLIEKVRYEVPFGDHLWEIDVFEGENQGLVVAEVELKNAAETPKLPEWLGKEVSDDPRYYNASLIRHPYTRWMDEEG